MSSVERLTKVLGFDPAKNAGGGVFAKAMDEVKKKREEAALSKATALIEQAMDLRQKMDDAERAFNVQKKKFEKELGKLVGRIEGLAGGKTPAQIEAEEKERESQEKDAAEGSTGEAA